MSLGRDADTGKYKQLSRTYRGDAAAAEEALAALVATELPGLRQPATNGHSSLASHDADELAASGPVDSGEGEAIRKLIAALPLEAGECVVGWSADRAVSAVTDRQAEYADDGAAVYRLVQLHRLRRHTAARTGVEGATQTVWVRRELVEQAQPQLEQDCAVHVWTV